MAAGRLRHTKIVATIGPASQSHEMVRELARVGMDAARLNFSHGAHEDHAERYRTVRAVSEELGKPLAVIADLQGPKLRVGDLTDPVTLSEGEQIAVIGRPTADNGALPVMPSVICDVLEPGHDVLIDDGLVRLRVETVETGRAVCSVVVGGVVKSRKGVNLPGVPLPIPSLTEKDSSDLYFAL